MFPVVGLSIYFALPLILCVSSLEFVNKEIMRFVFKAIIKCQTAVQLDSK